VTPAVSRLRLCLPLLLLLGCQFDKRGLTSFDDGGAPDGSVTGADGGCPD
jgi:hypothetical protein